MQQGRSNDFGQVFKLALMLGVLEARFELLQPGVYLLQALDLGHQLQFFGRGAHNWGEASYAGKRRRCQT